MNRTSIASRLPRVLEGLRLAGSVIAIIFASTSLYAQTQPPDEVSATQSELLRAMLDANPREAAAIAEKLVRIVELTHGKGQDETAWAYVLQMKCLVDLGADEKARRCRDTASLLLDQATRLPAGETAAAYCALAASSFAIDDLKAAEDLATNGIDRCGRSESDALLRLADILVEMAASLQSEGQEATADRLYGKALRATDLYAGEPHVAWVKARNRIADAYIDQRRFEEAARLCESTALVLEGPEHAAISAILLTAAADAHIAAGDYLKAQNISRHAFQLAARSFGVNDIEAAEVLSTLARACILCGNWDEGERHAKRVVRIAEQAYGINSPSVSQYRVPLISLYFDQGKYTQAAQLLSTSITALQPTAEAGNADYVRELVFCTETLGSIRAEEGQLDAAEGLLQEALAIHEKHFGLERHRTAHLLKTYASICWEQGRFGKAETLYSRALDALPNLETDDSPGTSRLLTLSALSKLTCGKWRQAAQDVDVAVHKMVRHLRANLSTLTPTEQLRVLRKQYSFVSVIPLTLGRLLRDKEEIRELSTSWLINTKALAHEASAIPRHKPGENESGGHWVDVEAIRVQLPQNAALVDLARITILDYKPGQMESNARKARYAAWVIPAKGLGEIEIIDLGDAIAIDTAVERYRTRLRSATGVNGLIATTGEQKAEEILRQTARPLVKMVLEPILTKIRRLGRESSIGQLVISPDGELWMIPWAALPINEEEYLIDQFTITTVTSARDLLPNEKALVGPRLSAVFGDPLFGLARAPLAQAVQTLPTKEVELEDADEGSRATVGGGVRSASGIGPVRRLPESLSEARRVAYAIERLTGERPSLFLQARALEEQVKRVRSPRFLHFATHGFTLPDQALAAPEKKWAPPNRPEAFFIQGLTAESGERLEDPLLRCGLLLTGCNLSDSERPEGVEDGCLTGKEIVGLDLRGTELVVLSACDTGTGRVQYGEGVAGLRQAFLIAGADAVLASLWQVPDAPTADLMGNFFAYLAAGKSRPDALRQAQLDLIETRRRANGAAHPAAWAAFELTGR